jgi:hypothetical protein
MPECGNILNGMAGNTDSPVMSFQLGFLVEEASNDVGDVEIKHCNINQIKLCST